MWINLQCTLIISLALIMCNGCEKSPSLESYQAVVENVANGSQTIGSNGELVLPANQSSNTANGKAYATTRPSGGSMILFPTWKGKGANLRGYLYCPGPALTLGSSITVNYPIFSQPGTTEIKIDKVAAPNWYYVSCTLD